MVGKAVYRLIWGVALLVLAPSLWSTPSPSQWRHISLLGANDTQYYLLVTQRSLPGSYYSFTERWFLEVRRLDDRELVERSLLRAASFRNEAEGQAARWVITDDRAHALDLGGLLSSDHVMAPYPSQLPAGLRLVYRRDKTLALTYDQMEAEISGPVDLFPPEYERPRIRQVFGCNSYTFVLVESGHLDDVGYKQVIIPISAERLKQIRTRYRHYQHQKAAKSPPVGHQQ